MKNFILKINRALAAKKTKLFTLFFALAASAGTIFAEDYYEHVQIGDLYYILDATNQMAAVTYKSYHYDTDGSILFNEDWNITSITIPSSVEFESVTYTVVGIGACAFCHCFGLNSITIPNSVAVVGDYAFFLCYGLTSVTIPNSVTSIGDEAFSGCSSLTSITIPNSVTSIGNNAFSSCTGLTSVTIPNSVTSIGYLAFSSCSSLTSVTIGNSVTSIGGRAFDECSSLKEVHISDIAAWCAIDFEDWTSNPLFYAHHLYINNTEITDLVIPNSVTSIGDCAFYGCSGLTNVTIPNSVTSIGNNAFAGCGLTSIEIPNSVTSIGDFAFGHCGLTSIEIPKNLKKLGSSVFYECNLESIIWNARNCEISSYPTFPHSFDGNLDKIRSITIGNDVEHLPSYLCDGMSNLETIIWNAKSATCGGGFYDSSYSITSFIFGEEVDSIPDDLCRDMKQLQSINIPSSVSYVGYAVFTGCEGLTAVHINDLAAWCKIDFEDDNSNPLYYAQHLYLNGVELPADLEIPNGAIKIGDYAFYDWDRIKSVIIPGSVDSIGYAAFQWCSNLTTVTMKYGVKQISPFAFDCYNLRTISIPSTVDSIGALAFISERLEEVYNYASTPQYMREDDFYGYLAQATLRSVLALCKLYVPEESINLYKTAEVWRLFGQILPLQSPEEKEAIEDICDNRNSDGKVLHDGQILIRRGDKVFTVTGQEVK